ncbi:hypothetical protein HMPREF1210_00136 [Paenisporosarcina sp. HGH0030]|uniref:hypothetical protein n=1 Tax=Paenisporosarcina sp. HGH0030 TaxID=1078085 RepID=UPI00034E64A3|nr:hypothetical protein [Paenisporosarcina sp. HGH0030]EPD54151.1 hypothetical protein HMPREF1210_00136 [Paenisporosarcina sp. HGH0030]
MISDALMNKHKIQKVWSSSKREDGLAIGFLRAYLGECTDGKWLIVILDKSWKESEVLLMNTRDTAVKRIRERGFLTRMCKIN